MIKANELRIGNMVCCEDGIIEVEDTLQFGINKMYEDPVYDYDDIDPIPITPEWLVKFGFNGNMWNEYDNLSIYHMFLREGQSGYDVWFHEHLLCRIQHIHQLQNLYFALTGEELESTH